MLSSQKYILLKVVLSDKSVGKEVGHQHIHYTNITIQSISDFKTVNGKKFNSVF